MGKIYDQLSLEERTMIHTQLGMGLKPTAIARGLNRSASTLSRELRRNGWTRPETHRGPGRPPMAGGYRADMAQTRAQACTVTPRVARRLRPGTTLWDPVMRYLKTGYSPEQIAGILARVQTDTPMLQVSHETIYTAIYSMPRGALRTEVIGWLRFGHVKRRPRARGKDGRGRIPDMVSIHDRPSARGSQRGVQPSEQGFYFWVWVLSLSLTRPPCHPLDGPPPSMGEGLGGAARSTQSS